MRGLAGEKTLLKRLNRAAILRLVWENPGISRSAVSERMGITKSTVGQLVQELESEGWLSSGQTDLGSNPGRPSIPLTFNHGRFGMIGVELGLDAINAVAVDPYGHILAQAKFKGSTELPVALKRLKQALGKLRADPALQARDLLGVGVGVPGPVDVSHDLLLYAPNLSWKNLPLSAMILTELPELQHVYVDNDANLAVFSEYMFGAHKHSSDLLYLYLNNGIGGGLILEHQLYRGQRGFAGEIGHMTILPNGTKCSCGNHGCAETLCSWRAVKANLKRELGYDMSVSDTLERLSAGDPQVRRIIHKAGVYLGIFLGNLTNIFDPKLLIVGGPIADLGAAILGPALNEMHKRMFGTEFRNVSLEPCAFGEDACAVGAAGYAFHELLQSKTSDLPTLRP